MNSTPEPPDIGFGQRLKIQRTRKGMTREVLAGLVGKSASWIKALETGRLQTPKLPVLLRLAEALRVRDLAQLTGDQSVSVELFTGPGHSRLPAVRAAVNALPALTDRVAPPVEHLRARLSQAWTERHSSPNHREALGQLLPSLIEDAQLAAHQAEDRTTRRRAQATLAEVYALSQFFIAYQPAQDLLWRVAERGIVAAQDSGDLHAIGVSAWLMAQAHRDTGDWDAADMVTTQTMELLEPRLNDAGDDPLAIWGSLVFESGYTAAHRGEIGNAWGYWDRAREVAGQLPDDYYHPVTSFSQAIIGAHATTIAVELHAGGEGVRQSERTASGRIPSRPRRARHEIEQARAYYLDAQPEVALATLEAAHKAAPETIRYNGYARRILLEELDERDGRRQQRASALADRMGMLNA
ncbi:helix-turn-helix protein [Haloactinospora alba]|uniref:Helix-turn-helix protein n=1 Tax=Haloactinospora alba TaxID=405555 RepID=A0A543N7D6_9ACTN|nr:helix-turn-helix domain-containing protein [Haloactinospora alba]TQN27744.1 helix-turn-helix protein [Haloactinospora alba]